MLLVEDFVLVVRWIVLWLVGSLFVVRLFGKIIVVLWIIFGVGWVWLSWVFFVIFGFNKGSL